MTEFTSLELLVIKAAVQEAWARSADRPEYLTNALANILIKLEENNND